MRRRKRLPPRPPQPPDGMVSFQGLDGKTEYYPSDQLTRYIADNSMARHDAAPRHIRDLANELGDQILWDYWNGHCV